jgi:hypothetical protein
MSHTKEPWKSYGRIKVNGVWHVGCAIDGTDKVTALTGYSGAGDEEESIANASRIIACVNACAGIPTEQLEAYPGAVLRVMQQRDELLAALHKYRDNVLFRIGSSSPYREVAQDYFDYINPILASVKGQP